MAHMFFFWSIYRLLLVLNMLSIPQQTLPNYQRLTIEIIQFNFLEISRKSDHFLRKESQQSSYPLVMFNSLLLKMAH